MLNESFVPMSVDDTGNHNTHHHHHRLHLIDSGKSNIFLKTNLNTNSNNLSCWWQHIRQKSMINRFQPCGSCSPSPTPIHTHTAPHKLERLSNFLKYGLTVKFTSFDRINTNVGWCWQCNKYIDVSTHSVAMPSLSVHLEQM